MGKQRHKIGKAVLNLKLSNKSTAIKEQQQLSSLFHERMLPEFQDIFDQFSSENEILQFEKLEISINPASFSNHDQLLNELKEKTREVIQLAIQNGHYRLKQSGYHALDNFIFFLNNGYLKWNYGKRGLKEIANELIKIDWNHSQIANLLETLTELRSRQRFFRQTPKSLIEKTELLFSSFLKVQPRDKEKLINAKDERNPIDKNYELIKAYVKLYNNSQTIDNIINAEKNDYSVFLVEKDENKQEEALISTEYAGIVLLNPVMITLFEYAELLDKAVFISEKHAEKAVFILNYLVSGKTELMENQTVLFKILCGLDMSYPLSRNMKLSEDIKVKCEQALTSVIKEWKALKNTNNQALLDNFIKRNGTIHLNESNYVLNVEGHAVDVLLAYNPPPWTVGMIRFPWMTQTLIVNWF